MMTTFQKALFFALKWEGGYSDHPSDSGGPTYKGITQKVYDVYRKNKQEKTISVKEISNAEVEEIYLNDYWVKSDCYKLSDPLAVAVFDTAVNMGVSRAKEFLFDVLKSFKAAPDANAVVDFYLAVRKNHYLKIVNKKPSQKIFLQGWMNRVNDLQNTVNLLKIKPVKSAPQEPVA